MPGAPASDVKAFFDQCVTNMSLEVVCNEGASKIPQPVTCDLRVLDGYTQWVNGWIFDGRKPVCQ